MFVKLCVFVTTQTVLYVLIDVLNSLSSRTTELPLKQEIPTHGSLQTEHFPCSFPGCESPEEQQKSDHYCPDWGRKYTIMRAAVCYEVLTLIWMI